jgi:hypothetical protein
MQYLSGNKYTQDAIDKANILAHDSETSLAKEVGKYKGYQDLMFTKASDLFKPITTSSSIAAKQEADEDIKKAIQNDSSLTAEAKAKAIAILEQTRLEKHTPKDEVRKTPAEIREQEIDSAFSMADDFLFGLVPIDDAPDQYVFSIINALDNLHLLRGDINPMNHHRVTFDKEKGVIKATMLYRVETPEETDYPYSRDLLWLLTKNMINAPGAVRKQYMSILDKCVGINLRDLDYYRKKNEDEYYQFLAIAEGNLKWEKWICVKYNLPLRVQPRRGDTSTTYTNTSILKYQRASDDSEEGSDDEGKGIQKVFIPPNADDRIKRAFVLLGQRKSSMEDNPDALAEFTAILDSMMSDGKLATRKYKLLMKKWQNN